MIADWVQACSPIFKGSTSTREALGLALVISGLSHRWQAFRRQRELDPLIVNTWRAGALGPRSCDSCEDSNGLQMGFTCFVDRVECGWVSVLLPDHTQRLEVGATLYKTRNRATMRLLEALKWVGVTLLLISCAMLVYLGVVLLTQGAGWILVT